MTCLSSNRLKFDDGQIIKISFRIDAEIIATALSATNESDLGFFGITGASLALMMTGSPFEGPVAGVRIVAGTDGNFIFDPSFEEEQNAKLNLLVAGTLDAITMVESAGKEVSQAEMMAGLKFASNLIKELCNAQNDFIVDYKKQFGIPEITAYYNLPDESLFDRVAEFLTDAKLESLYGLGKKAFQAELDSLDIQTKEFLWVTEENAQELGIDMNAIGELVYKRTKQVMRKNILEQSKRLDLRQLDEVRPIKCETGLLPRVHGSALFQRGMTQALSITTLWGPEDIQIVDDMYEETTRRYIHHYNFPPFSVGEVRMLRWVGRREIGHGKLAEKALEAVNKGIYEVSRDYNTVGAFLEALTNIVEIAEKDYDIDVAYIKSVGFENKNTGEMPLNIFEVLYKLNELNNRVVEARTELFASGKYDISVGNMVGPVGAYEVKANTNVDFGIINDKIAELVKGCKWVVK